MILYPPRVKGIAGIDDFKITSPGFLTNRPGPWKSTNYAANKTLAPDTGGFTQFFKDILFKGGDIAQNIITSKYTARQPAEVRDEGVIERVTGYIPRTNYTPFVIAGVASIAAILLLKKRR